MKLCYFILIAFFGFFTSASGGDSTPSMMCYSIQGPQQNLTIYDTYSNPTIRIGTTGVELRGTYRNGKLTFAQRDAENVPLFSVEIVFLSYMIVGVSIENKKDALGVYHRDRTVYECHEINTGGAISSGG